MNALPGPDSSAEIRRRRALPEQDAIRDAIAKQERLIAHLERQQAEARNQLHALKGQFPSTGAVPESQVVALACAQAPPLMTPTQKVALFKGLFRGRDDVFPKLWVNSKNGKKGYAPACSNEWVRGICEKPRVKCGECPNQAFIPVADQVIIDHLQGRHVIGVYPLLKDETCWFLAADFDKASWQDDVAAFAETCRSASIPAAVERSRSGNGAHVWFFFTSPIPAKTARRMGCFLITETMARRHELSMNSYDRLFPNQDTMPHGGFGNLIALPLQHEPRQHENTLFVDDQFKPHRDQWGYLASLRRVDPATVEAIAKEAIQQGKVIGVGLSELDDEEAATPWMRAPSGRSRKIRVAGPLPSEVRAVLAQRIFVEKAGVPSPLVNQIKRLAAFQNPEFYKKQAMRLSTALTPRVVTCAEDLPQHITVPRGCLDDLRVVLADHGIALRVDDQRQEGDRLELEFKGQLTATQEQAAQSLLRDDIGVFVAPPGIGKTVVGTYLVAARRRSTLILVHRKPLLDQWVAQLSMFLGIPPSEIGRIGGGKNKPTGRLDVAMVQSLVRKGSVSDDVAKYGHVIVDECHHLPAVSFERVLAEVKARYITGLTATPYRRDGHQPILHMQCGPVRFAVDPKNEAAKRPFSRRLIVRETSFAAGGFAQEATIQEIYAALAADEKRNGLILDDVIAALVEGRSPIVLTERTDHLEYLADRLRPFARHLIVLQGRMSGKDRREAMDQLATTIEGDERLILATGRYIGEGFDDARLDTLFLALPVSWKGTLVQYTGRLHRLHSGKTEVRIYDYVDRHVLVLARMFGKRLRGYRAIGYEPEASPQEKAEETNGEVRIEWDEEALRSSNEAF
ncbi:MAG: DEAD/DEAH box helicase family protein [Planctomycetes bacterium]|nr:DEAD/DEAH box helicase family protein [Planctomycetota bacterium]